MELQDIKTEDLVTKSMELQAQVADLRGQLKAVNDEVTRRQTAAVITERWSRMSDGERAMYAKLAETINPKAIESGEKFGKI